MLDVAWLTMMEEVLRSKSGGDGSASTDTSGSVSSAHGNVTHSQIVRLVQTIFSTYIFSPDHPVTPIGLSSAALKRLTVRADAKGRVKYAPGIFKSASTDVRHHLDSEVLPAFKASAHFRALFILMNVTSQVQITSSGEVTLYACPFVPKSSKVTEESEEEQEAKKKRDDLLERLHYSVAGPDSVEALVEEEKAFQKKNANPSISSLPSVEGMSSSKHSLPSSGGGSMSGSRSKLHSSPFAVLLPGGKRKASVSENGEGGEETANEKKGSDWMKRSFALTSKKGEKDDASSQADDKD